MFAPVPSPYLVGFDGQFEIAKAPTTPPEGAPRGREAKKALRRIIKQLRKLQPMLYAQGQVAVLMVFQAMDAAGKDGTIKAVMSGVNPAGCQVYSFKGPSAEELDHDFLWRTVKCLPEQGRIGIFNRSYYEEVLVVKVHPEHLVAQKLPADESDINTLFQMRYQSIASHEQHLSRNGTLILKFWLNVSKEEQKRRFLKRIDEPDSNWKFSNADLVERGYWNQYMAAYEQAINATSRPYAPWYAIPADDKPYMRLQVASILRDTLMGLNLSYPEVSVGHREHLAVLREQLMAESG